jgi:PD-(D/E)XK nuclease superfamily
VIFSYSQISQYLRCPKAYRLRYLEGWREKEDRATLVFGRCFETALAAFFRGEDSGAALFQEWSRHQDSGLEYSHGDRWERILRQGIQLLERLAQEARIRVPEPQRNLQVKLVRALPNGNEFVSYIDALGTLDGQRCVLEWKTTTSRYLEQPEGLVSLDPQLICYSWMSGISDVAIVAFLRKRFPEIQYLKTSISEAQRREFGDLVAHTVSQIEAGQFASHSGIRFPASGCVSCAQLGLCLDNPALIDAKLVRRPGAADLDWLNDLDD